MTNHIRHVRQTFKGQSYKLSKRSSFADTSFRRILSGPVCNEKETYFTGPKHIHMARNPVFSSRICFHEYKN